LLPGLKKKSKVIEKGKVKQKLSVKYFLWRIVDEKNGFVKWRKVHPVVRMLLDIIAGESHCERAFSLMHGFINHLRTRTSNVTFEMQMVLYDYFRQPNLVWETFLNDMACLGKIEAH
jgi:hypothetical protein